METNTPPEVVSTETQELIIVKQLPEIFEQLHTIKGELEAEIALIVAMPCNLDTWGEIKKKRSALNARFKEFEERRKAVKKAILVPYDAFEKVYEECVAMPFGGADEKLKEAIGAVEEGIKSDRRKELSDYLAELCVVKGIDFDLTLEKLNIRVGLSDSMPAIKKTLKATVEDIAANLLLIGTLEYADEIRVEFRASLNVSQAAATVRARHAAIDTEKARRESLLKSVNATDEQMQEIDKIIAESAPTIIPAQIEPEVQPVQQKFRVTFTVTGTLDQIKALKQFLTEGRYDYEQHN